MSTSLTGKVEELLEKYDFFERLVAERVKCAPSALLTTNVDGETLWAAFIGNLPPERRQYYTCNSCKRFIQTYGGLVNNAGKTILWQLDGVPKFFQESVAAMGLLVEQAKITGVFLTNDSIWGTPINSSKKTGDFWTHLHGNYAYPYTNALLSAEQAMAEKREDYKMLRHALGDYDAHTAAQAVRVLEADVLDRSEKTLGIAKWFLGLHQTSKSTLNVWNFVSSAPVGWCHIRSTMISTLLDDIKVGLDFDTISKRWSDKMHPLKYQRPTAAPSQGQIEQAEKQVEALGIAKSLERRFAKLEEIPYQHLLWRPVISLKTQTQRGGIFDHLKTPVPSFKDVVLPAVKMTWEKFKANILPHAEEIHIKLQAPGPYFGLVTAVHADAPPLIKWDSLEKRNPFSWYFYNNGSFPERWHLSSGFAKVNAVFLSPHLWSFPTEKDSRWVGFVIDGAWDTRTKESGLALFPEILRSELHGVRKTIEAHSSKTQLQDADQGNANGLAFQDNAKFQITVRVNNNSHYILDRWD